MILSSMRVLLPIGHFCGSQISTTHLGRHSKSCRIVRITVLPWLPCSPESEFIDRALIVWYMAHPPFHKQISSLLRGTASRSYYRWHQEFEKYICSIFFVQVTTCSLIRLFPPSTHLSQGPSSMPTLLLWSAILTAETTYGWQMTWLPLRWSS